MGITRENDGASVRPLFLFHEWSMRSKERRGGKGSVRRRCRCVIVCGRTTSILRSCLMSGAWDQKREGEGRGA